MIFRKLRVLRGLVLLSRLFVARRQILDWLARMLGQRTALLILDSHRQLASQPLFVTLAFVMILLREPA